MTGWDTRAVSGLKAPKAISTNINPTQGVAGHYGGAGPFKRSKHADCRAIWRSWQNFHMSSTNKNNYNDIAYNLGVCHHNVVLEGRSTKTRPRIRGGANGNATVNGNRYSVVAIWGSKDGAWPDGLKTAWRFARDFLRAQDSRTSTKLTPHSAMSATSCPGDPGRAFLKAGAPKPSGGTVTPPPPPTGDDDVSALDVWKFKNTKLTTRDAYSFLRGADKAAKLAASRTATALANQAAMQAAVSELAKAVAARKKLDPEAFAALVTKHAEEGASSALRKMISDARVELTVEEDDEADETTEE